ncbi:hypothetical protein RSW37_26655, partial [Escherichia coli]|uniref:hypothetical protein n=1 Tax=Escherichia coli TaxID=562 RepID=UPI0028DE97BA
SMVRIADQSGKVVFANRALQRMLKEVEEDVRRYSPGFRAESFVGGSVGDIYPDGAAAVARLQQLNDTERSRMPLF